MMTEDPWKEIAAPSFPDLVNARRVDSEMKWDFFWARGPDRSIFLTLVHASEASPRRALPRLRGIEISVSPPNDDGKRVLAFKLLDSAQRDIFHSLCRDIVLATRQAESESEAVATSLSRTWRWHYLLRGGGGTLLSPQEQKGLMGEMLALERLFLPRVEPLEAVTAWRGPLGAAKDFQIGCVAIEVKSHSTEARDLMITNEDQLDESTVASLFLYTVELNEASRNSSGGINVIDLVDRIVRNLISLDPRASEMFESRVEAAGLRMEDDYTESVWLTRGDTLYSVREGFPRIRRNELRKGVSQVAYVLAIADCEPYTVSSVELDRALNFRSDTA